MAVIKSNRQARPAWRGEGGRPPAQGCKPFAGLLEPQFQKAGRNNNGHHHLAIRAVVTNTTIAWLTSVATRMPSPQRVERIEYDPNRTAHIALVCYADGERPIIAPRPGSGRDHHRGSEAPIRVGNALPIGNIPWVRTIHNIS